MIKTRSKANLIPQPGRQRRIGNSAGHLPNSLWRMEGNCSAPWIASNKVTKADIRRVANETFNDTNRTVGVIETTKAAGHSSDQELA